MKKIVWENKTNGQLCVTIPKGSGIKPGDIVNVEKEKIKRIVYSMVVADLFHYGHLQFLEKANEQGDFHICGVLTDSAALEYRKKPVANFDERRAIISNLRCVDMVLPQKHLDPTENLEKINNQFKDAKIILIHADNWDNIPGEDFVGSIKGEVLKLPYYKKLSDEKVELKLKERVQ